MGISFSFSLYPSGYSLDLDKKLLNFELEIPLLRIRANYNLNGHILLLPLVGNGDVRLALKDVKTAVYTKISLRNAPEVCSLT